MTSKRGSNVSRPWDGYRFRYIPKRLDLTRETKQRVMNRAWYRWRQNGANFAIYVAWLLALLGTCFGPPLVFDIARQGPFPHEFPELLIIYTVFFIIGFGGHALMQHFRFAPCVWAELQSRGYPICVCGYPTDALEEARVCPECGRAIEEPRLSPEGGR